MNKRTMGIGRKGAIQIMKIFDYADLGKKNPWDYTKEELTPEVDGIKPILTTDRELFVGELLIINGTAYYVCSMSGRGGTLQIAYVKKMKNQSVFVDSKEPKAQNYTSDITCPYCGAEIEGWEMNDEEDEHECECCRSTFSYQREVTVEYCSQPVKKADAIRL